MLVTLNELTTQRTAPRIASEGSRRNQCWLINPLLMKFQHEILRWCLTVTSVEWLTRSRQSRDKLCFLAYPHDAQLKRCLCDPSLLRGLLN